MCVCVCVWWLWCDGVAIAGTRYALVLLGAATRETRALRGDSRHRACRNSGCHEALVARSNRVATSGWEERGDAAEVKTCGEAQRVSDPQAAMNERLQGDTHAAA
jgi:hypothetical protein